MRKLSAPSLLALLIAGAVAAMAVEVTAPTPPATALGCGPAAETNAAVQTDAGTLLPNGRQALPGVLTGGQPSPEQLCALAAVGYRTVVDLRTPAEAPPPMADQARELGLRYVQLPVAGPQDLTPEKVARLGELLNDAEAHPLAIYCASGNRAAALLALEQAQVEGKDPQEALAIGLAAGLTKLEPRVRELLHLPPLPPAPPS
jgi:uncharacterized protein (TIGR01244 family)